jgi:L-fuconolactonase
MIIDTHTHFGDPSRPNGLLYRTAMPETYKALAVPEGVTGTVVVEAQLGIDEVRWTLDLAADDPFIVGFVANIDPYDDDFERHLGRAAENPILSGIRVHTLKHRDAEMRSLFFESIEDLAARDLELDVHVGYDEFEPMFDLARRLPDLRMVINHIGQGRPINGETPGPQWTERMRSAAQFSRVYCKVSALVQMTGLRPAPADAEFYRPALNVLWDAFGEDRLIYGSNWPQIEAVSDFATAQRIVTSYFEGKGSEAGDKFFWKNAGAAYRYVER